MQYHTGGLSASVLTYPSPSLWTEDCTVSNKLEDKKMFFCVNSFTLNKKITTLACFLNFVTVYLKCNFKINSVLSYIWHCQYSFSISEWLVCGWLFSPVDAHSLDSLCCNKRGNLLHAPHLDNPKYVDQVNKKLLCFGFIHGMQQRETMLLTRIVSTLSCLFVVINGFVVLISPKFLCSYIKYDPKVLRTRI